MIDDESIPPLVQPKGRCVRDSDGQRFTGAGVFRL